MASRLSFFDFQKECIDNFHHANNDDIFKIEHFTRIIGRAYIEFRLWNVSFNLDCSSHYLPVFPFHRRLEFYNLAS